jgi:hypothetical protein
MKGLSQILYLIIAAAVLMMIGLAMITAFDIGVGSIGADANRDACIQSLESQCRGLSASDSVVAPTTCYNRQDDPILSGISNNEITCSQVPGFN